MTNLCILLTFACLLAALFRARLVAIALAPPVLLILARMAGLVDLSSASHPLRWIVPIACAGLAFGAAALETQKPWPSRAVAWAARAPVREFGLRWQWYRQRYRDKRALVASIIVLASNGPDLLALHPFFWARFATWPLVPVQIVACVSILTVLLAPERWMRWLKA